VLRRLITEEPMSRLAAWSSRLAWFALILAALSVIAVRTDFIEIMPGLVAFGAALALAGVAILFSFGAAVVIWREGYSGIGRAAWGFILSVLLLAYPGYLAVIAYHLPTIRDITTDAANPPRFDALSRLRPRGTSDYPGPQAAALQRQAYPDVAPLQVLSTPRQTYDATLALVSRHKWRVVDARPPAPPARREGTIEAVARTTIMGFREDVAIRITPLGTGAQVDIRSASRFGDSDFGSNASRIVSLLEEIDEVAGTPPEPRAEPQRRQAPQQRQPARR
jgi:uncharacterized protein (DUF1499 family)